MLNRFGHGISYEQVLEIETILAEKEIERDESGIILPRNVQPNVFSTFCWDNIDLLEETFTGKGTTHCTNRILIQREVVGCDLPPQEVHLDRSSKSGLFFIFYIKNTDSDPLVNILIGKFSYT